MSSRYVYSNLSAESGLVWSSASQKNRPVGQDTRTMRIRHCPVEFGHVQRLGKDDRGPKALDDRGHHGKV